MRMTEEGLALIREFEGFAGTAYRCPAGIWTIGFGHTSAAGPPKVTPGLRVDREEAAAILSTDVETFSGAVRHELRRELSPQQFSAIVSFAYNVGIAALRRSSVLRALNDGTFETVPRRLSLWVKAGGKILPGLKRRRQAEAQLFMRQEQQS